MQGFQALLAFAGFVKNYGGPSLDRNKRVAWATGLRGFQDRQNGSVDSETSHIIVMV